MAGSQGGIVERKCAIHVSNVGNLNAATAKRSYRFQGPKTVRKVRIFKSIAKAVTLENLGAYHHGKDERTLPGLLSFHDPGEWALNERDGSAKLTKYP